MVTAIILLTVERRLLPRLFAPRPGIHVLRLTRKPFQEPEREWTPKKSLLLTAMLTLALAACSGDAGSEACRASLECRAQTFIEQADVYCKQPVEKLLGPGMSWDQARERELVSSYRWKDQAKGTIAYFGDKALVQTPNGAARMRYECDVDPDNGTAPVFEVRTATGQF